MTLACRWKFAAPVAVAAVAAAAAAVVVAAVAAAQWTWTPPVDSTSGGRGTAGRRAVRAVALSRSCTDTLPGHVWQVGRLGVVRDALIRDSVAVVAECSTLCGTCWGSHGTDWAAWPTKKLALW